MKFVENYRKLLVDLRSMPSMYFDRRSPLLLHAFVQGYQAGDQGFCECFADASDAVEAKYKPTLNLGIDAVLYAVHEDEGVAYEDFISELESALGRVGERIVAGGPAYTSLADVLVVLRRRPGMLTGTDVRDLRLFLEGLFRALDDLGFSTARDRVALQQFEGYLREYINIPGRWDKLLFGHCGGATLGGVKLFVEIFDEFTSGGEPR